MASRSASALLNSTRFVVQAVVVAVLAVVLVASLSPDVKAEQDQAQQALPVSNAPFGACETPGVRPENNFPPGTDAALASLSPQAATAARAKILSDLQRACVQSMQGFQNAYRLTFYGSIVALVLAVFLPGWPGKWGGRGSMQTPVGVGH